MNRRALMELENKIKEDRKIETVGIEIDKKLFIDTFGQEFIDQVTINKEDSIRFLLDEKHYPLYCKNKYYHNLRNYAGRADAAQFENFLDLYPTNVAILDYVIRNLDEFKGKAWLDFGCGLGMLGPYLDKLGIEFYGYDNFSQGVPKEAAIDFLKKYNLENRLVDVIEDDYNVVSSIGIFNDMDFNKFKCLEYVFDDAMYRAIDHPILDRDFKRKQTDKLIVVYKWSK